MNGIEVDVRTLREAAEHLGLAVGTAVNVGALVAEPAYRAEVAAQFSTVTAEDDMKWERVEPTRGAYDWTAADRLMDFARENDQRVRGHTLVFHNQLPDWLTGGTFSDGELRELLRGHVIDEASHFRGRIWQWDVVNEAFNDDGTMRESLWLRALGPGYVADAFRWAHAADPDALLFYNDYDIETIGPKSDAVYALVKSLRAEGVPIHGVGFQAHATVDFAPADLAENMARFTALDLDTAVTEADVRMPLPADGVKAQAQAAVYSQLLKACIATRRCLSFTVWGFTDAHQWVPSFFPGHGSAAIEDENLRPKPAFDVLLQDLRLASARARQ
ncbi:MAG: endo-1,4-beta-xylanase [Mycobacteriales bacterium]